MEKLEPPHRNLVIFDDNPENLVKKVIAMLDEQNKDINTSQLVNQWFLDDQGKQRHG